MKLIKVRYCKRLMYNLQLHINGHRLKERSRKKQTMMEKVLLSITAASVLCAVSSYAQRQYRFVYEPKTMTEAQSYCRDSYTDLATIDNMEDVTILNNMADLSKMKYKAAWIGLYDDVNSWRWSLSDRHFYKPGEAEFRKWYPGQPANYLSAEYCTQMYDDGQWNDEDCTNSFRAVCSDVRGSNVTFVLINTIMTWTEAQSHCREHYTDLASVRNEEENQKVKDLIPAGQKVWIGLFRDSWKWSDGSNSSFRYWSPSEPNDGHDKCVAANFGSSGQWENWHCDTKTAFVCYKAPASKYVVRVSLKKNSALDLNDPVVMENILKQLKQRLKQKGVNGDIKLSWRKQSDGKVFHKVEKKTKKDEF
ncbi:putative C-type lectin domain family 20 member A isoform X1 [Thunnus maccoyii]|uniref:putative C-type lectin domain family 20 member A isoform X1 n=2 Tax=Thunnus maccoyii TaxID=8240 RepID=UPI001C4C8204|nr:putative C-type lectin domain family 20 member A isoform X1 [Thunnus maccoyii]